MSNTYARIDNITILVYQHRCAILFTNSDCILRS